METTQPVAKNLPVQRELVKFKIYDRVRVNERVLYPLPSNIKVGDVGIIDGVMYVSIGWVHVSFDSGSNHGISMKLEEIELVT